MASFTIANNRVAIAEGGYQKIAEDIGNYNSLNQLVGTNWGINAQVYESWIGYPPSEQVMRDMTRVEADIIYKVRFWDDMMGDAIIDQFVADIIYDGRVNHGRRGIKLLQEVLGVTQDGAVGPITLNAINSSNPAYLYNAYKNRRIKFYYEIVDARPNQIVFLQGWLYRMDRFTDYPEMAVVVNNETTTDNTNNPNTNTTTNTPATRNANGLIIGGIIVATFIGINLLNNSSNQVNDAA